MKLKSIIKKSVSVLLTAVMIATVCISPLAASAASKKTPVIVVPGITNTPLYDEKGNEVFYPKIGSEYFAEIKDTAQKLLKTPDTQDYEGTATKLMSICHKLFDPIACNPDGSSKNNLHAITYSSGSLADHPDLIGTCAESNIAVAVAEKIGYDNVYMFTYDWRQDLVSLAKNDLRKYVEMVKRETGSDKVTMMFSSMGGAIGNVYMAEYGTAGDLQNVMFSSAASKGVTMVNAILSGDVEIIRQCLVTYIANNKALKNSELYSILLDLCAGYATDIANNLIRSQLDRVIKEFVVPVLGQIPGIWQLTSGKNLDECISRNLDPVKHAKLIETIKTYQEYQKKADKSIKKATEAGVNVRIVGGYALTAPPLTSTAATLSTDSLIDSASTTFGGTFADMDKGSLGDNYKQAKDTKDDYDHVSADKFVDASTCVLPSTTWIVKYQWHVDYTSKSKKAFAVWLLTTDEPITVASNEKYPQFLCVNGKNELVTLESTIFVPSEDEQTEEKKFASSPFVYTYEQITLLGWLCYIGIPAAIIIVLIVLLSKKGKKKNILAGCEIEGLTEITDDMPKKEKKAAQKANKKVTKAYWKENKAHLIAQYKFCNDKMAPYAVPGLTPITDDMSKKDIKAAEKSNAKARKAYYKENKKEIDKDLKANKKQKKADKKQAKKDKKAAKKEKKSAK